MLTADYLDSLPDSILELYEEFQQSVIDDIVRRLVKMGSPTATAAWQMQRLSEAGFVYEDIIKKIAAITGQSEKELIRLFSEAGVKATTFDNAIYKAAGLDPTPLNLSPMMYRVLVAGINKTAGSMRNLTLTTAISGQEAFIKAADQAYMQVISGAFDYNTAIRNAVTEVGSSGLDVIYQATGHRDRLDVAMRRSVLTGVNQTVGQIKMAQMDELGVDLVQTSAHIGARNKGTGPANHEGWQGKIFSRSGRSKRYPDFVQETGYGTVTGLMGINCVLGDTKVSGPRISTAYRREYSGEVVIIRTATGHELTITPNHPILTEVGWLAAGKLKQGESVFTLPKKTLPGYRIDEFFGHGYASGQFRTELVEGYSQQFHGDGTQSEMTKIVCFPFDCGDKNIESKRDKISFIETRSYTGPVYNLETESGWYFANGIKIHNCRHNFYPYFEGISENAYSEADRRSYANKTVTYKGEEISFYEATQKQRAIERKIREWKRQAGALEAGGLDNTKAILKVREWQGAMREFVKQTRLNRQYVREQI